MSRLDNGNKRDIIISYNYLLYFKFFYKYIKDFSKDFNIFFYDLKISYFYLLKFKELNETKYRKNTIKFFNAIIKEDISFDFKKFIKDLIYQIKK